MAKEYLFFDMECADGTHVCSVGYVLCDRTFAVREKKDLLINPECPFRLSREGFDPFVQLAYSEKEFYDSPTFAKTYKTLAALFTAPDRVILGHSISSDLHYLTSACARYHKPQLLPDVYDTQKFYAKYKEEKQVRSLEAIVADLEIDTSRLCEHKSCDDAEMSMLVAKELCARLDCDIDELLQNNRDGIVRGKDVLLAKALRDIKKQHPTTRRVPSVCLGDTDDYDLDRRIRLIEHVYSRGYTYTDSPKKCRIFVCLGASGARENLCDETVAAGKRVRKMTREEFSKLLGVPVDEHGGI